ncbi:ATP-binding protein, partial [Escherichia coli]|nr:ATP-binding protein [Escherichia coli]
MRIAVHDTGRGIPDEHKDAIFQEFVQLDNPQRERSRGMGLGLAIVKRSAQVLGHGIGLRSQPGRGSCFWV